MCGGALFGGGKQPSAPPPPPVMAPPPPPTATESQKGPVDQSKLQRMRSGYASTIKTQQGPKLTAANPIGKNTLGS